MKLPSEVIKLLDQEKLALNQTNLSILQFIYPDYNDYNERYGVLVHNQLGVASGIPLPNYVGSLDAALEATRRMLPGAEWSVFASAHGTYEGTVWVETEDNGTLEFTKLHQNASIALLIAAFQAKEFVIKESKDA